MKTATAGALLIVLTLLASALAPAQSAEEVLDKVRKKYDSIVDAEVRFTQSEKFSIANVEQHTSGTLFMKKGNRYRVEFEDQTIVTDGTTVWSYSASSHQLLIDTYKSDERSLTPERILTGAPTDFTPAVVGKEKVGNVETIELKLIPKDEQSFLQTMKLWVARDDGVIRKVELDDASGKVTIYTVIDFKINKGIPDSRFTYTAPPGADVVDMR